MLDADAELLDAGPVLLDAEAVIFAANNDSFGGGHLTSPGI